MSLPNYSRVRLLSDTYRDEGVEIGAVGYIIEVYADGAYEVEFSLPTGVTSAQIVVQPNEVERAEDVTTI